MQGPSPRTGKISAKELTRTDCSQELVTCFRGPFQNSQDLLETARALELSAQGFARSAYKTPSKRTKVFLTTSHESKLQSLATTQNQISVQGPAQEFTKCFTRTLHWNPRFCTRTLHGKEFTKTHGICMDLCTRIFLHSLARRSFETF